MKLLEYNYNHVEHIYMKTSANRYHKYVVWFTNKFKKYK